MICFPKDQQNLTRIRRFHREKQKLIAICVPQNNKKQPVMNIQDLRKTNNNLTKTWG